MVFCGDSGLLSCGEALVVLLEDGLSSVDSDCCSSLVELSVIDGSSEPGSSPPRSWGSKSAAAANKVSG